jgi:molybdopterin-guanine dinucleotide biosynthesis protein A
MSSSAINGLVLAGGHSMRMGTDKGLLIYNGKPQREFLFELLKEFCHQVYTSCRKDQQIPEMLNPLPDRFEIAGPMNGVLSAFSHRPDASWLTIAVDMPYVSRDNLQLLVNARDQKKIATCFYNPETQQPEPLLTLWESEAYPLLLEFTEKGNVSPREFLKTHHVNLIQPPDDKTLLNFNTPEDLPEGPL